MKIQDIEVQRNFHIQIQNPIMVIVTLNHRLELVHHTQDPPTLKTNIIIILITHVQIVIDHNHFTKKEMEIIHDNYSHAIEFAMCEFTLTHS